MGDLLRINYTPEEYYHQFQIIGSTKLLKELIDEYKLLEYPHVITASFSNGEGHVYIDHVTVEPTHLYTYIDAYDVLGIIFWIDDNDIAVQIKLKYANNTKQ